MMATSALENLEMLKSPRPMNKNGKPKSVRRVEIDDSFLFQFVPNFTRKTMDINAVSCLKCIKVYSTLLTSCSSTVEVFVVMISLFPVFVTHLELNVLELITLVVKTLLDSSSSSLINWRFLPNPCF